MPSHAGTRRLLLFLTLTLLPLWRPQPAHAFDTGPHQDMTRAAFQDEGFSPGSPVIGIAQISNWLVDYYSSVPTYPLLQAQLAHAHFDNLTSPTQIRNVWNRLTLNTQSGIVEAVNGVRSASGAAERYRRKVFLALLIGASLHPVQDFYSHSNWVELYPMRGGVYGTRTWFDTPSPSPALHTGLVGHGNELKPTGDPSRDHGGYHAGMNHDSYSRPGWSQAYVYAYSASRQWLRAVRQWVEQVDPGVWQELMALRLGEDDAAALANDVLYSYYLSLWVKLQDKNGTWKGEGSGDLLSSGDAALDWMPAASSIFVRQFVQAAYVPVVHGMNQPDTDPGAAPPMPRVALHRRAVEVRTLRAAVRSGSPDTFSQADLYARVTIGGQQYVEATQQDQDPVQPAWLSVGLVSDSAAVVQMRYELFDEDNLGERPDVIDVGPAAGRTFAEFTIGVRGHALSGDLRGVHESERNAATLRGGGGDDYPASVTLYVTLRELENPPPGAVP
jgi:hypothetical protein